MCVCTRAQAKSHCVNQSTRHLAANWDPSRMSDIVLLEDCMSAVGGFEDAAATFIADMEKLGVTVADSSSAFAPSK